MNAPLAAIVVATLAMAVLLVTLLTGRARSGAPAWGFLTAGLLAIGALAIFRADLSEARIESRQDLLAEIPDPLAGEGFVGSAACKACHPSQYGSWHDSYHSSMTQKATTETVMGDFSGVLYSRRDTYRLHREGDEFWVNMVDPEWEAQRLQEGVLPGTVQQPPRVDRRVVMTTGSHHMQTYWVGGEEDGGLYNLPFMWVVAEQRWVPLESVFLRPPDYPKQYIWWHSNCIACHAVAGEEGLDEDALTYEPRVGELGIACEACHGPGREHVEVNENPERRYRLRVAGSDDPTVVNPAKLPAERSTQVCAQCHGIYVYRRAEREAGERYRAGEDLLDTHILVRATENMPERERADWPDLKAYIAEQPESYLSNRFWRDGMARVSGRESNAMTLSPCYQGDEGEFACVSCHSLHGSDPDDQLAAGMRDDAACLQCHASFADTLAVHTRHLAESTGSRCYNCHMPHTTYGLMKAMRSHLVSSPTAAESVELGRPNACNLCHLNETLRWTADTLSVWYGQPDVVLDDDQESVSVAVLWALAGDAGQRALMAWHLGWQPAVEASGDNWVGLYLSHLLNDPYPTVRYIAQRSLRRRPAFEDWSFDHLAGQEERFNGRQEAINRWADSWSGEGGPAILIADTGAPREKELQRLAASRDDRPVDLKE